MDQSLSATLTFSVIGFLVNFGFSMITPILPLYALTFNITLTMVGSLVASVGASKVLLDIPAGVVADRVGVKQLMLVGLGLVILSAIISASALNYWMLLFGLILQGVGTAMYFTTSYIGVSRLRPASKRGQHLSIFISLQFLGSTSGPILGGLIGQSYGLGTPFYAYALLVAVSMLIIYCLIDRGLIERRREEHLDMHQLTRSLHSYTLGSINLGLLSISVLRIGLIATILPIYAARNLGLNPAAFGGILTLFSLGNFVTLLPAGSLSDRYGRRPFLFFSLFLSGLLAVALPFSGGTLAFTAIMIAMGVTLGLSGAIGAWVTDVSPPKDLGASMGLFRTMGDLGSIIGPILLTALLAPGSSTIGVAPFLAAGGLISASSLLLIWARDPVRATRGKAPARR
ncbi:MAG: MFS transporter [Methanomassiliicoccus sp.]|nr:MFS transporter [Methanomassiliicoccus sp.]